VVPLACRDVGGGQSERRCSAAVDVGVQDNGRGVLGDNGRRRDLSVEGMVRGNIDILGLPEKSNHMAAAESVGMGQLGQIVCADPCGGRIPLAPLRGGNVDLHRPVAERIDGGCCPCGVAAGTLAPRLNGLPGGALTPDDDRGSDVVGGVEDIAVIWHRGQCEGLGDAGIDILEHRVVGPGGRVGDRSERADLRPHGTTSEGQIERTTRFERERSLARLVVRLEAGAYHSGVIGDGCAILAKQDVVGEGCRASDYRGLIIDVTGDFGAGTTDYQCNYCVAERLAEGRPTERGTEYAQDSVVRNLATIDLEIDPMGAIGHMQVTSDDRVNKRRTPKPVIEAHQTLDIEAACVGSQDIAVLEEREIGDVLVS